MYGRLVLSVMWCAATLSRNRNNRLRQRELMALRCLVRVPLPPRLEYRTMVNTVEIAEVDETGGLRLRCGPLLHVQEK